MAKRIWTKDEIEQWRNEHHGFGYFNKEDSNIFIPKRFGVGLTFNWGNPISWIIIAAVIAMVIVIKVFLR